MGLRSMDKKITEYNADGDSSCVDIPPDVYRVIRSTEIREYLLYAAATVRWIG